MEIYSKCSSEYVKDPTKHTANSNKDIHNNEIPKIAHKIWITSPDNAFEISDKMLFLCIKSLKLFPKDWIHNFWCLDKNKIPKTINKLRHSSLNIKIREIKEIYQDFKNKGIFEQYLNDHRYTFASDMARYNIVFLLGGFYSDIGKILHKNIIKKIKYYNYVVHTGDLLNNCMFACAKNSKFLGELLGFIDELPKKLDALSNNFKDITLKETILWTGPIGFTASFDKFVTEEENVFFVSKARIKESKSLGSWYKGSMGNKSYNSFKIKRDMFSKSSDPKIQKKFNLI